MKAAHMRTIRVPLDTTDPLRERAYSEVAWITQLLIKYFYYI